MARSAADKMADYRRRQKERGLRLYQRWVPDTRTPEFKQQLRETADILRNHPSTREGDEFVEAAISDWAHELDEDEGR